MFFRSMCKSYGLIMESLFVTEYLYSVLAGINVELRTTFAV
jgi:hypothetical protein